MTDAELIARLRGWARDIQTGSTAIWAMDQDLKAAADRIEALTEQLNAARQDAKEAEAYAEELEANLAKAGEALTLCRDMFEEVAHPSDPLSVMLNQTLAEIKGESHD